MGLRAASLFLLWLALSSATEIKKGRTRSHGHYVCSTWGNNHFKTFDGDIYQFPGLCEYNFVSDCREAYKEFSVHIQRALDSNGHPEIQYILMKIKDIMVYLKPNLVVVDGRIVKTPYYSSGVLIESNEIYTKIYAKLGMVLMWNQQDALMVELDNKFNNHTCGLCGDYNGIQIYNEFIKGDASYNSITYGNMQKISKPNSKCEDPDETQALPSCNEHRDECQKLLTSSAFADCRLRLNLEMYIQACMQDKCACNGKDDSFCLCSTISEYSRQCSHAGGRPGEWRTQSFCPKTCPATMVYRESSSPCMDTCSHLQISSLCEEHYMDGCFCPEGTVYDDISEKGCIPVSQCYCKLGGKSYAPGESISKECEECTCNSGRWTCKDLPCPGTCSVEGGSHFTTFDGKKYTFHGDCYYVLAKGTANESYALLAELAPCGSTDKQTCLKTVVLLVDNKKNVVVFRSDGSVLLNEMTVNVPHVSTSFSVFKPSSNYFVVQTPFGLQVQIQLFRVMQLFVTVDQSVKGKLQGLCGNFNGMEGDDFRTTSGLIEATGSAFANTWKAQSTCTDQVEKLEDPCSLSIESANYAEHWCSLLRNPKGPFARCHIAVDPSEYYKKCKYDTCLCEDNEECLCAALSSYSRACAFKGIILGDWRKSVCSNEASSCPGNQVFLYNLTMCQQTCRSLADGEKYCLQDFAPVDGCGCPSNTYLDNQDNCVPISQCPCYYKGSYLEPGEYFTKDGERCVCRNAKIQCTSVKLRMRSEAECSSNKTYFDCNAFSKWTSQTPLQLSCHTPQTDHFQTECVSGCVCPEGLFDDGRGGCVEQKDCPCIHNNEWYYSGGKIKVDCNTCTCQKGVWKCTEDVCYGTCMIYGSGHYNTFDGKFYDFDGSCEYVATQDFCGDKNSSGSFSIITENVPCGTTGVTCSKAIKMFLGKIELKLENKESKAIQRDVGDDVQYWNRTVGLYLVIEASNGVMLIWDKKTTVFIKLSPDYKGKVCGLCGNFDDKANNDFTTRSGLQDNNPLNFGNSWKQSPMCPDVTEEIKPCDLKPHRKSWAEKECSIIQSDVFKICHSKVDPLPYYEACVHDACSCDSGGDCECFCSAVAAYAQECIKAEACVFWRTPDICPIFCDYYNPRNECDWHYEPCGSNITTCRMINNVSTNFTVPLLEGCYPRCPKDKPIYNEDTKQCVTEDQCGCYLEDGTYVPPWQEIPTEENCTTCICVPSGSIECKPVPGCPCVINGTSYEEGATVGVVQDGDTCTRYICAANGSVVPVEVYPCPTSSPTTISTSSPHSTLTTTTTVSTTSRPVTTTPCVVTELICDWTEWFDVSKPEEGGGDYETYDEIRKHGNKICTSPKEIECRAKDKPDVSLEELGQKVECNVKYGLICKNDEQDVTMWPLCYNYEIRVNCCEWQEIPCEHTTTPTVPSTSTTTQTTIASTTTTRTSTEITTRPIDIHSTTCEYTPSVLTPLTSTTSASVQFLLSPIHASVPLSVFSIPVLSNSPISIHTEHTTIDNHSCTARDSHHHHQHPDNNHHYYWINKAHLNYFKHILTNTNIHHHHTNSRHTEHSIPYIGMDNHFQVTGDSQQHHDNHQHQYHDNHQHQQQHHHQQSTDDNNNNCSNNHPNSCTYVPKPKNSCQKPCASNYTCECIWTDWIDVTYPDASDKNSGDYETFENIWKKYPSWDCAKVENISCRAEKFPSTSIADLGQKVECNVNVGLICNNKDQQIGGIIPMPVCLNYEISVCCTPNKPECLPTPSTTSTTTSTASTTTSSVSPPISTTAPTSTSVETRSPTITTTTTTTWVPPSSTTTSGSTSETTRTAPVSTTPVSTTSSTSTPTPTYTTTTSPTPGTTPSTPSTASPTAELPTTSLETSSSTTTTPSTSTPATKTSLIGSPTPTSTTSSTSSPSPTYTTSLSTPGTPPSTLSTPKSTTTTLPPETTTTTTSPPRTTTTVPGSTTTISTPQSTTPSTPSTPQSTTSPSTPETLTTTSSTTMPPSSTTSISTPSTTTVTGSPTPTSTTPSTSTPTPTYTTTTSIPGTSTFCALTCFPASCECIWTDWIDVTYPDASDKNSGDYETFENIWKKYPSWDCAKVENISCRAEKFPSTSIADLGQKVECNVNVGLICNNKDQQIGGIIPMPVCLNYEISVCCTPNKPECLPTPSTTSTTTSTASTTTSSVHNSIHTKHSIPYSRISHHVPGDFQQHHHHPQHQHPGNENQSYWITNAHLNYFKHIFTITNIHHLLINSRHTSIHTEHTKINNHYLAAGDYHHHHQPSEDHNHCSWINNNHLNSSKHNSIHTKHTTIDNLSLNTGDSHHHHQPSNHNHNHNKNTNGYWIFHDHIKSWKHNSIHTKHTTIDNLSLDTGDSHHHVQYHDAPQQHHQHQHPEHNNCYWITNTHLNYSKHIHAHTNIHHHHINSRHRKHIHTEHAKIDNHYLANGDSHHHHQPSNHNHWSWINNNHLNSSNFPSYLLFHELVRCSSNEAEIESSSKFESIAPPYLLHHDDPQQHHQHQHPQDNDNNCYWLINNFLNYFKRTYTHMGMDNHFQVTGDSQQHHDNHQHQYHDNHQHQQQHHHQQSTDDNNNNCSNNHPNSCTYVPKPKNSCQKPCASNYTCECIWTDWIDVTYPDASDKNSGDYETFENIWKKYPSWDCAKVENISCRAEKFPSTSIADLGQKVECNVNVGLICNNKDQQIGGIIPMPVCLNYEISVCCTPNKPECLPTPSTTSTTTSTASTTTSSTESTSTLSTPKSTTTTSPTETPTTTTSPPTTTTGSTPKTTTSGPTPSSSTSTTPVTETPIHETTTTRTSSPPTGLSTTTSSPGTTTTSGPSSPTATQPPVSTTPFTGTGSTPKTTTSGPTPSSSTSTTPVTETPIHETTTTRTSSPPTGLSTTTSSPGTTTTSGPSSPTATQPPVSTTPFTGTGSTPKTTTSGPTPSVSTPPTTTVGTEISTPTTTSATVTTPTSPTSTSPVSTTTAGTTPTESFTTTSGTTSSSSITINATTTISTTFKTLPPVSTTTSGPTATSTAVTTTGSSTHSATPPVNGSTTGLTPTTPKKTCTIFPNETYEQGDSWILCNCTKVICIEDNIVQVIPIICNPPPKPTCSNGLSPVPVMDEDGCCWHWECDCYCTGWGDPHYMTFDGLYYSYQGNCTYVLVEEINKKVDNFGVYIDNYHCDARDVVSCPRTLIVRHETQEVRLTTAQPNTLQVEVTVNNQLVALPYKKFGVSIYESGINSVVEIPELKMNVTYNGLSFSIRMPYSLFGNNTQGQCGTCNNNTADDCMLPNGNIAENCETMADHWQVVDPSKPQCSPGLVPTGSPSTTPTQPCKESSICELILGSVFKPCHAFVQPEKYYAACVFDSCVLPNLDLECSSLQIYAATCADQGACIDWRKHTNGVCCKYECPSGKEYRACGPIKETTCKSRGQNETSTKQVEGCFCPNGTMLYDSGVDVCVKTCGCVGVDMVSREFGEKFTVDCKDCICLEGEHGIVCEPHVCDQKKVTCEGEGFYEVTEVNPKDSCCPLFTCKCNTSSCTAKAPKCSLGFEVHSYIPSGQCCPVYQCVPKGVCVHENAEFLPNSSVFVDKCQNCVCTNDVNVSTQLNIISCERVPCNTYCQPGYELKPVKGECCGKCVQTKCIIKTSDNSELILSPGDFKNDPHNNCTIYSCVDVHDQLIASTSEITCPAFNEDSCKPGTISFLPNGCCRTCAPLDSSTPCSVRHRKDFIVYNGCRSVDRVDMTECEGTCGTFSLYSAEANSMDHSCSCCRETRTTEKYVVLKCPGGHAVSHKYIYVESCSCQDTECQRPESNELQKNEVNDKTTALNRIKRAISLTSK
ncbi:mucin-2 [Melospiza georgiana]|nr:mucin-2 [Melospiza georgiana]